MLEEIFDPSSSRGSVRIRSIRQSSYGALLDSFSAELINSRYARETAQRQLVHAHHFASWASRRNSDPSAWTQSLLEGFGAHLRRSGRKNIGLRNAVTNATLFFNHLRTIGIALDSEVVPVGSPKILEDFHGWMRGLKGTSDGTLANYDIYINRLLAHVGEDLERLNANSLRHCFVKHCKGIETAANALRMFVRFLTSKGRCHEGLDKAINVISRRRLSSFPKYLPPEDVERLIASSDTATTLGKRNRAILLLLARLGLRAGDIVNLRLGDIDWKEASIRVCGKSRKDALLPLTQEVGDAIITYLQDGRPKTDTDHVFVRINAPFRPLNTNSVSSMVKRAMRRAHITTPDRGAAHLLRHSLATNLLRRGSSLQDIGGILRHRSIQTTEIYAKVDIQTMEMVMRPWPEA